MQLNKLLLHAAQEWRTTFDGIRDAVCLLSPSGIVLRCNRAMAKFLNKPFRKIVAQPCYKLIHNASAHIAGCPFKKMLLTNRRETTILRMKNKWFNISIDPIVDSDNKIVGAVHIMADITAYKQAEEALRAEKAYLEQLFETAQEAIIMADNSGRVLKANKEFLRLFGYKNEEVIGKFIDDLIVPKHMRNEAKLFTQGVAQGKKMAVETIRQRKDKSLIYVSVLVSPIVVGDSQAAVYSIYRDITERKHNEEALRKSAEEFRGLFENAPIGIYRTTPDGKILIANPALVDMLGYNSFEELSTQSLKNNYHPKYSRSEFKRKIAHKKKIIGLESIWKRKNGKEIYVSESARAVFDDKGRPVYYEGMVIDITQRKNTEEELKQNFDKLKKTIEGTVYAMAKIVEVRDPYTAGHQQRVAALSEAIAREMGLDDNEILGLRLASLIHDVGKIYVPAEILSRPTKLSKMEFALIEKHPELGYEILKKTIEFPWPVAEIILQHHERLNGSGYPKGLKSKDILLQAKILAVADVVEAMCSHRPYRPARTLEMTLDEIAHNRGILYDRKVVEICLKLFKNKKYTLLKN